MAPPLVGQALGLPIYLDSHFGKWKMARNMLSAIPSPTVFLTHMEYIKINPCTACGACCAFYRVSFYWGESDLCTPSGVPSELLGKVSDFRFCMRGTQGSSPRCIALMGIIGKKVHCSIYERRASVCREFEPSWQEGASNEKCDKARALWGLPPLPPEIWRSPGNFPKAA
ncbi:MAG: YkgJ family cysteine cluster protein [Desulfobacterales bacterium]